MGRVTTLARLGALLYSPTMIFLSAQGNFNSSEYADSDDA